MYLSVHATVGALVGQQTGNPLLAFGAGFASHLLLDVIPHGDSERSGMPQTMKALLIATAIDVSLLTCLILFLWTQHDKDLFTATAISGAFGGILPDLLQAPYLLSNGKYFKRYQNIHNFFHNLLVKKWDIPFPGGVVFQAIILTALISIIV